MRVNPKPCPNCESKYVEMCCKFLGGNGFAWTFRPGYSLRYYNGTLFYQDGWFKSPQIIWQMPKKVEE